MYKNSKNQKNQKNVKHIKDLLTRNWISSVDWVSTDQCHADFLTKKGVKKGAKKISNIFKNGENC